MLRKHCLETRTLSRKSSNGYGRPKPPKEPAIAGLHAALRPVLRVIEGSRSLNEAFVEARETVVRALYDANEAALGETMLAA